MSELNIIEEPSLCKLHGLDFYRFPIIDRGVPSPFTEWIKFVKQFEHQIDKKETIVAHCRMGIGRASMIAASLISSFGTNVDQSFDWVEQARGIPIPDTVEQRNWINLCFSKTNFLFLSY